MNGEGDIGWQQKACKALAFTRNAGVGVFGWRTGRSADPTTKEPKTKAGGGGCAVALENR